MKDFLLVGLIGFLVGLLILPIAANFHLRPDWKLAISLVIFFSLFAPLALAIIYLLGRFFPFLNQFGRFAAVGTLNTLLDMGILNLLIFFFGIASGVYFSLFKAVSFLIVAVNSYFWNKFWSFRGGAKKAEFSEFSQFAAVAFFGMLINNGAASFLNSVIGPLAGLDKIAWANIAGLAAVAVSFLWNFLWYRFKIFKITENCSQEN